APAPRRRRWRPPTPIAHTPLVTASWRALPGRGRSARTFHERPLIRHIPSARFNPFPRLDRRHPPGAAPWGQTGAFQGAEGRGGKWGDFKGGGTFGDEWREKNRGVAEWGMVAKVAKIANLFHIPPLGSRVGGGPSASLDNTSFEIVDSGLAVRMRERMGTPRVGSVVSVRCAVPR